MSALGSDTSMDYQTLTVTLDGSIATVRLARPDKANAMNLAMWHEVRRAFLWIDETPAARVAVLEGEGRHFSAGIDLQMMAGLLQQVHDDCDGRAREKLRRLILDLQETLGALERCRKPVLAAIRGVKEMLNYARDHSVADGLNQVATWNAAMLLSTPRAGLRPARPPRGSSKLGAARRLLESEDLMAATAAGQKPPPLFRD